VVEFALVVPILFFMVVAISDFGRLYTSAVAIESAAREAADYGSFGAAKWNGSLGNVSVTLAEMERRACVAAAGSHLQDYATSDPANNATCTNPAFTCTLEFQGASTSCDSSSGFVSGIDCSDPATDPACVVHVRLDYDFHTILGIPPFPEILHIGRDSYFRVSELAPVPAP
jgi:TadE-like protein